MRAERVSSTYIGAVRLFPRVLWLLSLCSVALSFAPGRAWANKVTGVELSDEGGVITLSFSLESPALPENYKVESTRSLLRLVLKETSVRTQWVRSFTQMKGDPLIKGILLRPTRERASDGELRIRFLGELPEGLTDAVSLEPQGRELRLSFPRDPSSAAPVMARSSAPPSPPPLPLFPQASPSTSSPTEDSTAAENDPDRMATEPMEAPPAAPPLAPPAAQLAPSVSLAETETPSSPVVEKRSAPMPTARRAKRADRPATSVQDEPLSSSPSPTQQEISEPEIMSSDLNVWMLAVLFFFVLALYFLVLYLKSRGRGFRTKVGEVHIEVSGSRMISPQQRLMVVEVLDQVILIGTHEHGMTMLTRLNEPALPEQFPVTPNHHAMPLQGASISAPVPSRATLDAINVAASRQREESVEHGLGALIAQEVEQSEQREPAFSMGFDDPPVEQSTLDLGASLYADAGHTGEELPPLDELPSERSYTSVSSEQEEASPKEEVSADDLLEKIRQLQRG